MLKLITKYRSVKGTVLKNKENKRKPKQDASAPRRTSGGRLLRTKLRLLKLCQNLCYVPQRIEFPKIVEVRLLLLHDHYVAFVNPLLSYLYLLLNLSPRLTNGGITNVEY